MKKKILIVDDETKMLRVLELQLQSAGYEALKAETAEDGLKVLESSVSDGDVISLVMTDLRLPGADGLEFLGRCARKRRAFPSS